MSLTHPLRAATVALHDVLANIEMDMGEAAATAAQCDDPREVRRLALLVHRWQTQHDKLAQFYDLDVFLDRGTVTDAHTFLAAFPQVEEHHTGGGCMAWRIPLASGYLLLTDDGGAYMPDVTDDAVTLGWYRADGEPVTGDCDICTWDEAAALVRERIGIAVEDAAAAQGFGLVIDEQTFADLGLKS